MVVVVESLQAKDFDVFQVPGQFLAAQKLDQTFILVMGNINIDK